MSRGALLISALPRVSLREPAFVAQVSAGIKGPFVDNVVTDCAIEVTNDVFERKRASIDIQELAWRLVGKHDPGQFKASTSVRLHGDPSGTYLLFPSERMVMTGVRCPELVLTAALRIVRLYSYVYGRICRLKSYHINNVHGVINMGYPLDLRLLHQKVTNSYHQPTDIKCVIFSFPIPLRPAPPETIPSMHHMLTSPPTPDFEARAYRPAEGPPEETHGEEETKTAARPRKRRRVSRAVFVEDVLSEEAEGDVPLPKRRKRPAKSSGVYTVVDLERNTAVTKKPKAPAAANNNNNRKRPKDPTRITASVWETGRVGILGRSEEHLMDAAIQLGALLAHFTMNKVR